jgi:glycerol-3-phosphate cytidylyltransferase
MKKYKLGYTTGVFDLFHIGHLNILRNAKSMCEKLIVGVTTDELAYELKKKSPVISYEERSKIVKALKYVDEVVPQKTRDEIKDWEKMKFDVMFKADDRKGEQRWVELERKFAEVGVQVVFFPYTKGTSSTLIKSVLEKINK